MKKGICKLCLEEKDLCEQSHIIPNHCYSPLKDSGSFLYIDGKTIKNPEKYKKFTGEFERYLFCKECELKMSKWETYSNKIIYSNKTEGIKGEKAIDEIGNKYLKISGEGYSYNKIKLYFLSILWRSSISSRPFFDRIKINSISEEELRKMIYEENPGDFFKYPCLIFMPALTINNKAIDMLDAGLIKHPTICNHEENDLAIFLINGCHYVFILNENKQEDSSIRKDCLIIRILTEEQTIKIREKNYNIISEMFNK